MFVPPAVVAEHCALHGHMRLCFAALPALWSSADCVYVQHAAGSDSYVTKCIWKAGYGMTDPGYSYMAGKPLEHFTFDRWTFRVRNICSPHPIQVYLHDQGCSSFCYVASMQSAPR